MIIDVETFYEIDAVERIRVSNQLMNILIFFAETRPGKWQITLRKLCMRILE
jgi:hypothetical protein